MDTERIERLYLSTSTHVYLLKHSTVELSYASHSILERDASNMRNDKIGQEPLEPWFEKLFLF